MVVSFGPRTHEPLATTNTSESFEAWRADVVASGCLPIIGVAGSRGKTTVVRLLDAMLTAAGVATATRTDTSVDIRGKRQRGEIAPWKRAISELEQGTLDIAIEELDWLTISTMGLERESYPVFAVTNLCANRDACLIQGDAKRAFTSLPIVFEAVHRGGLIVFNGDDDDVAREELDHQRPTLTVGLNRESPGLRAALQCGGMAAWVERGGLTVGTASEHTEIARSVDLRFALDGKAGFQVHNALTAGAMARMIGVPNDVIARTLDAFSASDAWMPDSFQVIDLNGVSVVVDRPNPSWFLRPVLRTLKDLTPNRVISVVGRLADIPSSDLPEVGRLLGRNSTLVVSHSASDEPTRTEAIKQGAAQNEVPPVILHTKSEGRALSRALGMAKEGDVVFVLADKPAPLARMLRREAKAPSRASAPVAI